MLPGRHDHLDRMVDVAGAAVVDRRQFADRPRRGSSARGGRRPRRPASPSAAGSSASPCADRPRGSARRGSSPHGLIGFDRLRHWPAPDRSAAIESAADVDRLCRVGGCSASRAAQRRPAAPDRRPARVDRLAHVSGLAHAGRLIQCGCAMALSGVGLLRPCLPPAGKDRRAPDPACRRCAGPPPSGADVDVGPQAEHVVGVAGRDRQDGRDKRAAQDRCRAKMRRARQGSRREAARQTRKHEPVQNSEQVQE